MRYCAVETELGFVGLASHDGQLSMSTLPRRSREEALEVLHIGTSASSEEDIRALGRLPELMKAYFSGRRVDLTGIDIDTSGCSGFARAVLKTVQNIPYGHVMTYGEVARASGFDRAARAVGRVMALNPVPIVIPCHRVIAADAGLGGFAFGLDWKRKLLELEGIVLS